MKLLVHAYLFKDHPMAFHFNDFIKESDSDFTSDSDDVRSDVNESDDFQTTLKSEPTWA